MTLKVLVVDDEPPARDRLRQMLAELPDAECVGEAATGEEAVTMAEASVRFMRGMVGPFELLPEH